MTELDLVLRGGTVVDPEHGESKLDVGIANGQIASLTKPGADLGTPVRTIDVDGLHLLPGGIDPHTHIGVGGGVAEYSLDTAAAAVGGVSTIFNILIENDDYEDALAEHLDQASKNALTDYAFHLTLMSDEHAQLVPHFSRDHGVSSFKYFMSFRGDEGAYLGVESTDDGMFLSIMEAVRGVNGVLMVHPENIEVIWRERSRLKLDGRDDLLAWHESRPPFAEAEAILRASYLAAQSGCQLYFVHLSGTEPIWALENARRMFPDLTLIGETCPHFLTHDHSQDLGSMGKVNPPLRTPADRESVWDSLGDGCVQIVGSDHVGRRRVDKEGSIWTAAAGFPGSATILPVLLSEGFHKQRLTLPQIARLTSFNAATSLGLGHKKGAIRVGLDADIAAVDLSWERTATAEMLGTWCDYSLYERTPLSGWPRYTFTRGQLVQENGARVAEAAVGNYLWRS